MAPLRVALRLLCLLAIATTASAECAWVLWGEDKSTLVLKGVPSYSLHWDFLSAHTTQDECWKVAQEKMKQLSSMDVPVGAKVEVKGSNIIETKTYASDGRFVSSINLRLVCLPDTVDPRGPKR